MLRRVQPIALKAESESSGGSTRAEPSAPPPTDRRQTDRRQGERRQGERRGMETLRAEALQQLITRVEDRNFGGLRNQVHWNAGSKNTRIVLIAVAVLAGSMAAFLAVQRPAPAPEAVAPVVEVVTEPRTQILAARDTIAIGDRVTPASFEWIDWPDSALRSDFITATASPEAMTEMSGSTARFAFFPGEPVRAEKLMPAGQGSFLSAVLGNGMRGVSVAVNADAASGGFVAPTDRVDVVLTRPTEAGGQISQTILSNVRVIAINANLGPAAPKGDAAEQPADEESMVFSSAIATLELDEKAAEVIMTATAYGGRLSLVLRAMVDADKPAPDFQSPANQAIRLSSPFWAK